MRNRIPLLGLCLLISTLTYAQTKTRKMNIAIYTGFREYSGDFGNSFFHFDKKTIENAYIIGFSISRYLNESFDLSIMGNNGSVGYFENPSESFKVYVFHFNGTIKYKLSNGYLFKENSLVQPYFVGGGGVSKNTKVSTFSTQGNDLIGVLGAGVNFKLSKTIGLNYQAIYGYNLSSDNRDGNMSSKPNDAMLSHSIGINFNIIGAKEAEEAMLLRQEKYRNEQIAITNKQNGTVDSDNDGVVDNDDLCPSIAGLASLKGCPDNNNAGKIVGTNDTKNRVDSINTTYTEVKEMAVTNGVVYSGKKDSMDTHSIIGEGSTTNGVANTSGLSGGAAVSAAGTGIPTNNAVAGVIGATQKNNRTTKRANRRANRRKSKNVDVVSIADTVANLGNVSAFGAKVDSSAVIVPTKNGKYNLTSERGNFYHTLNVDETIKFLYFATGDGIQFANGKAIVLLQSVGILDIVVRAMKEKLTINIKICGHTDDLGDDDKNIILSQERANAVSYYLITHGIAPERISTVAYGESRPIDSNKTKLGRANNRRAILEFIEE